jgi:glucosylceramidase
MINRSSLLILPVGLLVVAVVNCAAHGQAAPVLHWKCSTAESPWADEPDVAVSGTIAVPTAPSDRIFVDSKRQLQVIDGWGGCFNERGWKAMEVLSPDQRDAVMRSMFDPNSGLKLNICRTPIGASDYGISLYSLDETPGDYSMEHFSIARDEERLIPYIKAALAIRPDLKLWAVPWSPPSWMKDNYRLVSGRIKDDDQTLDALALYFAKYVKGYKADGISISMVMPQNEPSISSNYTSCQWTGEQLAKFIGYHLGPEFDKEGLGTKIFLGTIQNSDRGGYAYWVGPSMQDPNVRKYIAGLGCQWSGESTMAETHYLFPDLKLMQSEAECGKTNSNDWAFGQHQFDLAKKWFGAGASSNIIWNLVLDETGRSTGGWAQCSPIVVNSQTGAVTYTPYYYCYKHFSYFVQPGAHVVQTQSTWGNQVAFVNPDGGVVVVMASTAGAPAPVTLVIDGKQAAPIMLPPHSFNTFTFAAGDQTN